MKVLIANSQLARAGGMETYLGSFVQDMSSRGHEICVAAEYGVEPRVQETWCPPGIAVQPIQAFLTRATSWAPDVVLCNPLSEPTMEESLAGLAPVIFFAHTFYGTCVSGTKMHAFPAPRPCTRTLGMACLALYYPRRCGGLNPLKARSLFFLERRRRAALKKFSHILVGSQYMREEFIKNGVSPESVTVVGFPAEKPEPATRVEYVPGRVVYVGRLTKVKGVDLLLRALSCLPMGTSSSLVVAGDGVDRTRLMRLAAHLGVPAEFHGWVTAAEARKLIRDAACVAMPSVWPEPFGLVGLESVSNGVPVVAFDLGGVREWLVPGLNGELAPAEPPTAAGLADALQRVFTLRSRWESAQEARRAQLEKFNATKHFDRVEHVLRGCATQERLPRRNWDEQSRR